MAATKKSAKRSTTKKRRAKRPAAKMPAKASAKARGKKARATKATNLKRKARKGLKAARGGLDTVREAGEKTWRTLRTTTAQVVEGVKDTLSGS